MTVTLFSPSTSIAAWGVIDFSRHVKWSPTNTNTNINEGDEGSRGHRFHERLLLQRHVNQRKGYEQPYSVSLPLGNKQVWSTSVVIGINFTHCALHFSILCDTFFINCFNNCNRRCGTDGSDTDYYDDVRNKGLCKVKKIQKIQKKIGSGWVVGPGLIWIKKNNWKIVQKQSFASVQFAPC